MSARAAIGSVRDAGFFLCLAGLFQGMCYGAQSLAHDLKANYVVAAVVITHTQPMVSVDELITTREHRQKARMDKKPELLRHREKHTVPSALRGVLNSHSEKF